VDENIFEKAKRAIWYLPHHDVTNPVRFGSRLLHVAAAVLNNIYVDILDIWNLRKQEE
jgi:hypothetical protein